MIFCRLISRQCNDGIRWIRVLGPKYHETHGSQTCDVDELAASFQRLTHNQRLSTPPQDEGSDDDGVKLTQTDINSLDEELTSGKWMLFPKREDVDDLWSKIARATVTGALSDGATMAKVSPVGDDDTGAAYIAVYTPDYRDKAQIFKVEKEMRRIGIKKQIKLKYKPDINTKSGVYSRNGWSVKPSIYETGGEPINHRSNPRGRGRGRGGRGRGRGSQNSSHSTWSYRSRNEYDDFD
ncbi:UPF0696 protein C11orf68 homolog isoform X2 [Anneissia japonica]|uniref:UPF0696 protein C11orf68 homolog isoform X2 n=1 Tax=Anneissia japonica TaxID=1529436 RepID=UPI001425610B|nr:UPF0696 protein C11orf68 homolog isoform X2 [Anneissia japonica]